MNDTGVTLRDFLAAHASEADIQKMIHKVPLVHGSYRDRAGNVTPTVSPPENNRQIARYMHADAMLEARKTDK